MRHILKELGGWTAAIAVGIGACCGVAHGQLLADFEDLSLAPESYYRGEDMAGGFTSGGLSFDNTFTDWGGGWTSWSGWAYSNLTDTTTPGYTNEGSAVTGGGHGGSANYGVAYAADATPTTITLAGGPAVLDSMMVTNTTYAYLAMRDGDAFAKQFGGAGGDDEDWFKLTITGQLDGDATGSVDFFLADYRFVSNAQDYLVDQWTKVDLRGLGMVDSMNFDFSSTDMGEFGMNTPAYVAVDNITAVPEPASLGMLAGAVLGVMAWRRRRRLPG